MNIQRILFVIPTMQQGGAERVLSLMANFWAKKKYQVFIISFDDQPSCYPLDKDICYYNLNSSKKSAFFLIKIRNNFIRTQNYFFYVNKINPTVIISFTRNANMYCILYNFFLKRQLIVGETTNPSFPILPKGMNYLPRLIYKFATAIVVQTVESLKIFEDLKISLPGKKEIIYNPISQASFSKLYKLKRENIVLAVGRLENNTKQFDKLINIFNASDNDGWELHIAGTGSDYQNLKKQIEELNLKSKVFLLGSVQQLNEVYQEAKIFALTSIREGFPNALCEAMANGCACISYNCPTGPSAIINNNVNGILIEPGNEETFREKLSFLMKDEPTIKRISDEAYKIIDTLDERKIFKKWEHFIKEVVEN